MRQVEELNYQEMPGFDEPILNIKNLSCPVLLGNAVHPLILMQNAGGLASLMPSLSCSLSSRSQGHGCGLPFASIPGPPPSAA